MGGSSVLLSHRLSGATDRRDSVQVCLDGAKSQTCDNLREEIADTGKGDSETEREEGPDDVAPVLNKGQEGVTSIDLRAASDHCTV